MSYGDRWTSYPWGYSTGATTSYTYPLIFTTGGSSYEYNWPVVQQEAERPRMPESPLEWLRRRVTEITDLAYAEV